MIENVIKENILKGNLRFLERGRLLDSRTLAQARPRGDAFECIFNFVNETDEYNIEFRIFATNVNSNKEHIFITFKDKGRRDLKKIINFELENANVFDKFREICEEREFLLNKKEEEYFNKTIKELLNI
ncbi:MAG: hypothetical protein ACTH0S_06675 [Senegalia sp. (in: firmicutes)]